MRIANLIIAAIFAWCVIVQYNDPDPLAWMFVYGAAAAMAALAAFGRFYPGALLLLAGVCLFWMGSLSGGVQEFLGLGGDPRMLFQGMGPDRPWVEQTREFGGLAVILICSLAYFWLSRQSVELRAA